MDKRFLQSLGIELGMPRWKAYLLLIGYAGAGVVAFYVIYLFIWIFGHLIFG
ncbi:MULTISPECIES: hypothetical protein [Paenibacillus]|uniref:hypothetical protein n=1 Tax=Paenibacillus TaxID=44249 RepID=UPI000FB8132C|nr:hypothetical protein [Paenibacillus xylanexedens]RPK20116.1 hypothetical protein EDO6_06655 [Paenibacillus xylanexedens]